MLSIEHYEIIFPDSPRSPNVENKNFLFPLVLVVIPPIYLCMSERREHTLLFAERRHPSRAADGVRCENALARTFRETGRSDCVGGLCVSCVKTKVHMSTRTCVQRHHVWMTN